MQKLTRFAAIGAAVIVAACSNGPRNGWDTIGAGAAPGGSGGAPAPPSAVSVAPTPTPVADSSKRPPGGPPAKKSDAAKRKS